MATAEYIIVQARRRATVHAEEEPLEAVDAEAGFNMLKNMLGAWKLDYAIASFSAPALASEVSITYSDASTSTDDAAFGIIANLAARLCASYGMPIPQDVVIDADSGKTAIVRRQVLGYLEDSTYDPAIVNTSNRRALGVIQ